MACTANIFWCQWPDILWDWVELGGSAPGADLVHSSPIGDVSVWANESVRSSWGLQDLLWIHVLIDALRRPRGYAALWRTSSAIQRPSILSDVQHYGGGGKGALPLRVDRALSQHWPTVMVPGYIHGDASGLRLSSRLCIGSYGWSFFCTMEHHTCCFSLFTCPGFVADSLC